MKENDLKLAVSEYLEYGTNQGRWYSDRLNSGEVIEVRGKTRRRIKLCRPGTSDFFVIINGRGDWHGGTIFLECKVGNRKQSPAQKAFEILVKEQNAFYYLIRSIEELQAIMTTLTGVKVIG